MSDNLFKIVMIFPSLLGKRDIGMRSGLSLSIMQYYNLELVPIFEGGKCAQTGQLGSFAIFLPGYINFFFPYPLPVAQGC